jgi:hypothetical protein
VGNGRFDIGINAEMNDDKIQPVHFKSIGEFMDYLPKEEHKIVEALRTLVLDCLPNSREKLSYNVPYYFLNARVCFIWPASVPWGKVKMNGVVLGFCKGYMLNDACNYLEKGTRKQVYTKTFTHVQEIDTLLLKSYLYEALEVDKRK